MQLTQLSLENTSHHVAEFIHFCYQLWLIDMTINVLVRVHPSLLHNQMIERILLLFQILELISQTLKKYSSLKSELLFHKNVRKVYFI